MGAELVVVVRSLATRPAGKPAPWWLITVHATVQREFARHHPCRPPCQRDTRSDD
jgi:hypothetical protein